MYYLKYCLNPCYTGTYASSGNFFETMKMDQIRLNPCYTGTYASSDLRRDREDGSGHGLNPCYTGTYASSRVAELAKRLERIGLNPCYTGTYASRGAGPGDPRGEAVLILVILELTLRASTRWWPREARSWVLILVILELTLRVHRTERRRNNEGTS